MGAGIGPLVGQHGLMLDALESVRIVTAQKGLVTASKKENQDLFWAVRGAGANFGIVLEATYKVYDITNNGQALVADLIFPAAMNRSFFAALHSFDGDDMDSKLAMTAGMMYNRDVDQASDTPTICTRKPRADTWDNAQPLVVVHAVYFGSEAEGRAHLAPFLELGPAVQNIRMVTQAKLFPPDNGACVPNQYINLYTAALKQTDPSTLELIFARFMELWSQWPDYNGRLIIQRFSRNVVNSVSDEDTAYPWREAVAHL